MSIRARISVDNTTHMLTGWYKPEIGDYIGLRPTEIKGLWRWWTRAFVAGALYDLGILVGRSTNSIVLKPRDEEAKLISCLVGRVFGLGCALDTLSEASRFRLYIEPPPRISKGELRPHSDSLQREKLLTVGGRRVEYIDRGHRFTINIERIRSRYDDAETTALKILLIAMQFMGIGKGGRRGLGSLDIVDLSGLHVDKDIPKLIEDVYGSCLDIAKRYMRVCTDILKLHGVNRPLTIPRENTIKEGLKVLREEIERNIPLPPLPSISKRTVVISGAARRLDVSGFYIIGNADFETFVKVHNFFVRGERCRVLVGNPRCNDNLRRSLCAWILGLPREQRRTGYRIAVDDVSRRASPISLAYHSRNNVFGNGVFISVLVSGDWPRKLVWHGAGSRTIQIFTNTIVSAFIEFTAEFDTYLRKTVGKGLDELKVWPQ